MLICCQHEEGLKYPHDVLPSTSQFMSFITFSCKREILQFKRNSCFATSDRPSSEILRGLKTTASMNISALEEGAHNKEHNEIRAHQHQILVQSEVASISAFLQWFMKHLVASSLGLTPVSHHKVKLLLISLSPGDEIRDGVVNKNGGISWAFKFKSGSFVSPQTFWFSTQLEAISVFLRHPTDRANPPNVRAVELMGEDWGWPLLDAFWTLFSWLSNQSTVKATPSGEAH